MSPVTNSTWVSSTKLITFFVSSTTFASSSILIWWSRSLVLPICEIAHFSLATNLKERPKKCIVDNLDYVKISPDGWSHLKSYWSDFKPTRKLVWLFSGTRSWHTFIGQIRHFENKSISTFRRGTDIYVLRTKLFLFSASFFSSVLFVRSCPQNLFFFWRLSLFFTPLSFLLFRRFVVLPFFPPLLLLSFFFRSFWIILFLLLYLILLALSLRALLFSFSYLS